MAGSGARAGAKNFWMVEPEPEIWVPVSNEISDLCEISDPILLFSYFSSQNKGIQFGNYIFEACCFNQNFLIRCQIPTTSLQYGNNCDH